MTVPNSGSTSNSTIFHARSLGICAECGLRVTSVQEACQALGCIYHNSCFVCCCCHRSLRGHMFYKDQSRIYCEEDYLYCGFQRAAEKCVACGHIIAELILQAMGQSYHPGCFRCSICNECLDGVPFAVDSDNALYCKLDYYLVRSPRCGKCSQPILPRADSDELVRVCAMDKEFHPSCYRCENCEMRFSESRDKACYPLVEPGPSGAVHLLCLSCHIKKIGATPAPGQDLSAHLSDLGSSRILTNNLSSSSSNLFYGDNSNSSSALGKAANGQLR